MMDENNSIELQKDKLLELNKYFNELRDLEFIILFSTKLT